jgi:hypothetical protein
MMVSILCALSITACGGGAEDGQIDDSDGDEKISPSGSETEGREDSAASGAQDTADAPGDASGVNGQHITEAAACEALLDAQEAKIGSLKCAITTRICPSLIRMMTGEACVEYDEGSVQKCVERYSEASSCESLEDAISACAVTFYPGTKSADCN